MSQSDEKDNKIPLLPLRDMVIFPQMVVPLFVGRERSIHALEQGQLHGNTLVVVAQRDPKANNPGPGELFEIGTRASIVQLLRLPDGTAKVLIEGKARIRVTHIDVDGPCLVARVDPLPRVDQAENELEALSRTVKSLFETYVKLNKRLPAELLSAVQSIEDIAKVADTIAAHLTVKLEQKQALLEIDTTQGLLEKLYEIMQGEVEIMQVEKRIRSRVRKQIDRNQKEYYLNEQMAAIQRELGERDEFKNEVTDLEEQIRSKPVSEEASDKLRKELRKLKMMAPMSPEATVIRTYIETVLSLPWSTRTEAKIDIENATNILNEDHFGLAKIKDRILEYLAVQSLVKKPKGPILCLVGPPGVGKTSLGRSIARATGRKFVRLSLGGVRDEAEIRGHRRTYIGALPGKMLQSLKKAGSNNPVFLLDEIDKMSTDFRGDPSAALLEVLDPEQNNTFNDHYLDLDYDLSDVMFVTTANTLSGIPLPLQDRMEMIHIPGYTDDEKFHIARRYLLPRQLLACGLKDSDLKITDAALKQMILAYTKEAGVRNLEREISTVCRKVAREVVSAAKRTKSNVTDTNLEKWLGPRKFTHTNKEPLDRIGLVNGLAVTSVGGDLLTTEVSVVPGKGKLVLTGKLGDVMRESAQAALSYVRSRAISLGLEPHFHQKIDIHIHCPEGATPKDGPSAGITIATALVSALLQVPVRQDIAMTGEITLRGRVLPIGGLKEKVLAAHRSGITDVIAPADNEKDSKDIPADITKTVRLRWVSHVDEVLRLALAVGDPKSFLQNPSEPLDWRGVRPRGRLAH